MEQYPQILEPLLFYILHRANHIITNRDITHIFKAFFIDEAWTFFRNPRIKNYIVEALKTWRKQNAAIPNLQNGRPKPKATQEAA